MFWILQVHSNPVRETVNMKKSPLIKKHGSMVMAMMLATPQTRKKLVKDCYVYTQFYLALYMCVFILTGFPCGYF